MKSVKFIFSMLAFVLVAVAGAYAATTGEIVETGLNAAPALAMAAAAVNADRMRAIYKSLQARFPNFAPSPSYLRAEKVLSNNAGRYLFDLKKIGGEIATEIKLDRNDVFVIVDPMFYIVRMDSTKPSAAVLQTYPNETAFPTAAGFTPAHLEAIYNGFFQLKVGTKVEIENMPMQHFRNVPQTQQSAASNKSQYSVETVVPSVGSLIELSGTSDIQLSVEFPTFTGMEVASVTAGTDHKLVFNPYGFLIKGAAAGVK